MDYWDACVPGILLKQKTYWSVVTSILDKAHKILTHHICFPLWKTKCYENKLKCTIFFIKFKDIPGQAQESHIRVSSAFPTQDLPPNIGAGDVQLLVRRWVPPPQVTLHDDQGSQ